MRVTIDIPTRIAQDLKIHAEKERKSVSSLVTEFIESGIKNKKRRATKENMLRMIGKTKADKSALKVLDEIRSGDDRT